jgi:hypothetical protein
MLDLRLAGAARKIFGEGQHFPLVVASTNCRAMDMQPGL